MIKTIYVRRCGGVRLPTKMYFACRSSIWTSPDSTASSTQWLAVLLISARQLLITKHRFGNHQRLTSGDVGLILILATGSQVGHSLLATIIVTGDDGISLMWSWI
jgi:hypothetical protein